MLKFFISQNVTRPKDFNVVYYLGPYFVDDFSTNYTDGVAVTRVPDGHFGGIDFVEEPTDINSLIIGHSSEYESNNIGIGSGDHAAGMGASGDYSYVFVLPRSFSSFYDSNFNLNSDTEVTVTGGGSNYTYKFIPAYNGCIKTLASNLYFQNFPDASAETNGYISSINVDGAFGSGSIENSSTYVYPYDDLSRYGDTQVEIYTNLPIGNAIPKDDNSLTVNLQIGEYPLVYNLLNSTCQINQIDAYGNVVSTNNFTLTPTRLPLTLSSGGITVNSSRILISGTIDPQGVPSHLSYTPIFRLPTSSEYTNTDLEIQVFYDNTVLGSSVESSGTYGTPMESTINDEHYELNDLEVVVPYNYNAFPEGTDGSFRLVDNGNVVSTCWFSVSYSPADAEPVIEF